MKIMQNTRELNDDMPAYKVDLFAYKPGKGNWPYRKVEFILAKSEDWARFIAHKRALEHGYNILDILMIQKIKSKSGMIYKAELFVRYKDIVTKYKTVIVNTTASSEEQAIHHFRKYARKNDYDILHINYINKEYSNDTYR